MNVTESYMIDVGGGLTLHAPTARRLTRRDQEEIEIAMAACFEGLGEVGRGTVAAFETRLGLTEHDRVAAGYEPGVIVGAFVPLADSADRLARLRHSLVNRGAPVAAVTLSDPADRDAQVFLDEQFSRLDEVTAALAETDKALKEAKAIPGAKRRRKVLRGINDRRSGLLEAKAAALTAIQDREEADWLTRRRLELAALEAERGGGIVFETREAQTPVVENGAFVWKQGRQVMKSETLVRQIVTSRDGLKTLSTSHLDAEGEVRTGPDGQPMVPAIDASQYMAGMRFRLAWEGSDPERGLRAVDPESVGGGKSADDPWGEKVQEALSSRIDRAKRVSVLEAVCRGAAGEDGVFIVREVAGKGNTVRSVAGHGRKNARLTAALLASLDALADHLGIKRLPPTTS